MTKERQSQSLEELQANKERLEQLVGERQNLKGRLDDERGQIEVGLPGIENIVFDIRASRLDTVVERVDNSVDRRKALLEEVSANLEEAKSKDPLRLVLARAHIEEVRVYGELVKDLKAQVARNQSLKGILDMRIAELQALKARATEYPDLKRGIELLQKAEEAKAAAAEAPAAVEAPLVPKEAVEEAPKAEAAEEAWQFLGINVKDAVVEFSDEREVAFGVRKDREFATLVKLARTPKKFVSSGDIVRFLKSRGLLGKRHVSEIIFRLQKLIEADPDNPTLIERAGINRGTKFRLNAQVEFVGGDARTKRYKDALQMFEMKLADGQIVKVQGLIQAKTLEYFLKYPGQSVISREMASYVYGSDDARTCKNAVTAMIHLNKYLKPLGWQVVSRRDKGEVSKSYHLQKIPDEGVAVEKPKEGPPPVTETRMAALDLFINRPDIEIDEIVRVLGPSERTHRYLTRPQSLWALVRAANYLYRRNHFGTASEAEIRLWEKIKSGTGKEIAKEALKTFREGIIAWFKGKRAVSPAEIAQVEVEEEIKPLTDEEAAILAIAICANEHLIKRYGLECLPVEVADALWFKVKDRLQVDRALLKDSRLSALQRVEELIVTDKLYEFIGLESDEALKVLDYLSAANSERLLAFLRDLISDPEGIHLKVDEEEIRRRLAQEQATAPKAAELPPMVEPEAADEVLRELEELIRQEQEEAAREAAAAAAPTVVEQPPVAEKPKEKKVDREAQEMQKVVGEILDEIIANQVPWDKPVNAAQLTRWFPRVKSTIIKKAMENGYILPERGRDYHPVFTIRDIVIMIFLKDTHNGLHVSRLRKLERIIDEEIVKRIQNRKNQSAK